MTSPSPASPPPPFDTLTIIGLGLIGGSFAMACRAHYPHLIIHAVDVDPTALQYGLKHGIIDRGFAELERLELPDNHLIVLAAHLKLNQSLLQKLAPMVTGKDIVVTDIGSCKREIVALGSELLPEQFVGAHPMAGREFSGIQHATSLLFTGKRFLVTPTAEQATMPHVGRLVTFLQGLHCPVVTVDPQAHDEIVAYVSHLPQLYAILLTNLIYHHNPVSLLAFRGGGIDDQLRLAASPYEMWRDVFDENQDNLRAVLQEFRRLIDEVEDALGTPELKNWFVHSNKLHQVFQDVVGKSLSNL